MAMQFECAIEKENNPETHKNTHECTQTNKQIIASTTFK